ncbi:Nucleolar protein 16 [Cladophialophora chaetospira]|uniref:Nucleolar protein 16 n=1 Tax=Cladophialophora chaetospira TaxID=386627 RepID=A0AA38X805_9EURO|nr:Nucleolar protein 16 [Cladophialophora chaetospira]
MGRERQKKKNRSSISKAKPRDNRTKAGKRKVNFLGNETIAKNWNRKLTMSQNYKQLGLSSKLQAATGGTEKKASKGAEAVAQKRDSLAIAGFSATKLQAQEVQVERDPETGRIVKVIRPDEDEDIDNPLNDPLNDIMDYENGAPLEIPAKGVVAQLEAQAAEEEASLANKRPRQQSQREAEWLTRLIEKHGDDIKGMVRDRKLNPMQQTEGDISRRVRKWKASHEEVTT